MPVTTAGGVGRMRGRTNPRMNASRRNLGIMRRQGDFARFGRRVATTLTARRAG